MTRRGARDPRIDPDPDGERRRAARARLGLEDEAPATRRRRGPLAWVCVRLAWVCVRLAWGSVGLALLSVLAVAVLRVVDPPLSALMLAEWLQAQRDGDAGYRLQFDWRPAAAISPHLARAVIAAEDQKFHRHHGFDFDAIADALESRRAGGSLRGASTISQQVAKNLFLWRGRDWLRKGLEAWFTVWIEALWPKARILEIYLNLAQFGRGVYGAEAAGRRYFGVGARELDAAQSALLATALPAPVRRHVDRPSAPMRSRQQWILRQMGQVELD